MLRRSKFRIYPNKKQKELINKTFGCTRFVYNQILNIKNEDYKAGMPYKFSNSYLTELKREYQFLSETDSIALQQSLRDLDSAFKNFFKSGAGYPQFKKKRNDYSYRTVQINNNIRFIGKYIKLPKLGLLRVKQSLEISNIKSCTVIRTNTNKYFVSIVNDFTPIFRKSSGNTTAIDFGLEKFLTFSNGNVVYNPYFLEKDLSKIKRAQRSLSRKQKYSKNYNKQRIKLALLHENIANKRLDFLHKLSNNILSENQTVYVEDLDIKSMKNKYMQRKLYDVAWNTFLNILEYKSYFYGASIIKINKWYPSSQICSNCGYRNVKMKNLKIRIFKCPECKNIKDRDLNAACNILAVGTTVNARP